MKNRIKALFFAFLFISSSYAHAAEQVFFYHTDPAGTPLAMSDASGNVVWRADYKPFGEENTIAESQENDKRFVGKEKDEETGHYYFGARYMDPKTGRFIAGDPVRAVDPRTSKTNEKLLLNPQRLNPYAYAINNPYKYVDPDGRDIALVVDPRAAGGNGHTSLFFQDSKGNWYKYDQGAAGNAASSGGDIGFLLGLDAPAGVTIQTTSGPPDGSVVIKTSKEQDTKISDRAVASQKEHNEGKQKYNIYSNNCTDAATDVVNKSGAGLKIPNSGLTVKPNSWFKELKEWNK